MYIGRQIKRDHKKLQLNASFLDPVYGLSTEINEFTCKGDNLVNETAVFDYVKNKLDSYSNLIMHSKSNLIYTAHSPLSTIPRLLVAHDDPEAFKVLTGDDTLIMECDDHSIRYVKTNNNLDDNNISLYYTLKFAPSSGNTVTIDDNIVDGSENTKYIDKFQVSNIGSNVKSNNFYTAFLTPTNEIIFGQLKDNLFYHISRGQCVYDINTPSKLGKLNNGDVLKLLKINYIFTRKDLFLSTDIKSFENIKGKDDYNLFLGMVFCDDIKYVGAKTDDLKISLMPVNNVRLDYDDNEISTRSKRILISVCERIVDLDVDIIKWSKNNLINEILKSNTTYYIYMDSYGYPYLSSERPFYWSKGNYYRHYYEYWRCLGEIETDVNTHFTNLKEYRDLEY